MSRSKAGRLFRRLFILFVLAACLMLVNFGPADNRASAAICCSTCPVSLQNCLHLCAPQGTCNFCYGTYRICTNICDPVC
jgi:hypothetical protein